MRLSLFPFLPEALVMSLGEIGIQTDADLLFSKSAAEIVQSLPSGTLTLQDLRRYTSQVTEKAAALGVRGDHLLAFEIGKQDQPDGFDFMSGISNLDALLGPSCGSRVLELSGEKASGKTALAKHIMLRHLVKNPASGVLWIDTTGDFSIESMTGMISLHEGEGTSTVLQRLQVSLVFDIESAHDILEALPSSLTLNSQPDTRIRILVIDSITPLLGPSLSAISSQGHAIMTTFMRQLRALAQAFDLCIFVINNATSSAPAPHNWYSAFSTTSAKPALGPSFTFLTDATIWISRLRGTLGNDETGATHIIEVFRSKTMRSKTWCTLKICDGFLMDA